MKQATTRSLIVSIARRAYWLFIASRPLTVVTAGLVTALAYRMHNSSSTSGLLEVALPIMMATAASFLLNDVWDIEKDKLSGRIKPFAREILSPSLGIITATLLLVVGGVLSWDNANTALFVCFITIALAVMLYSPFANRWPTLKIAYAGILYVSPIYFGGLARGEFLGIEMFILVAAFAVARELLLDARDVDSDLARGLRTLAAQIGERKAKGLAWACMTAVGVILVVSANSNTATALSWLTTLILAGSYLLSKRSEIVAIHLTKLAMLSGMVAIMTRV